MEQNTKEEHSQKIQDFFKSEVIEKYKEGIIEGHPLLFRSKDDEKWYLNSDEIETILHEYHPELSAVVEGSVIVIFHESVK